MTRRENWYRQAERERLDVEATRETKAAERMAHLMGFCDPKECPLCHGAAASPNPYEAQRRLEKAAKLIDVFRGVLREQHLRFSNLDPDRLNENFWVALAARAGVRAPSAETRRMVIERMSNT